MASGMPPSENLLPATHSRGPSSEHIAMEVLPNKPWQKLLLTWTRLHKLGQLILEHKQGCPYAVPAHGWVDSGT